MEVGDRVTYTAPSWMDAPRTSIGTIIEQGTGAWWVVDLDGPGRVICHEAALQVVP